MRFVPTTLGRLAAILALILVAAIGGGVNAQTPAPPTPLPQDQFDALVKAITQSLFEKLKAESVAAPKPAEEKHSRFEVDAKEAPDDITLFVRQAGHVVSVGVPALITTFVDFGAALDSGQVGYAALDVVEEEPLHDERLRRHERVLLTPHAAFYSVEGFDEMRSKGVELQRACRRWGGSLVDGGW